MMLLKFKLNLQLFSEPDGGKPDKDKDLNKNESLLLEKITKLEKELKDAKEEMASVVAFNRKLLDGAKPDTVGAEKKEQQQKFEAYMKEK